MIMIPSLSFDNKFHESQCINQDLAYENTNNEGLHKILNIFKILHKLPSWELDVMIKKMWHKFDIFNEVS